MKYVVTILVCLLVAAFFGNYPILKMVYPELDQWAVFIKFYDVRNLVYAAMFSISFLVIMYYSKGFTKVVSTIGFFGAYGSAIDVARGINEYNLTDLLLIIFALLMAIYVHSNDRKVRRGG